MKVDRLISIIMILLDKERISAQQLADTFEVSLRTIYRDIDAIDLAGIPIRSTPGVGGGFEIMPKYKVDNKVFSAKELSTILMGLTSLPDMVHGEELHNTLAKIKSFIPNEYANDIHVKANQILIDLSPWMGNHNNISYLEIIKTALQENRLLSFTYIDTHGNKTKRTAEPYQLVLKSNHWYWQGYCLRRKDYRLFRLTRMSNLNMMEQTFIPRDYQKPQLECNDIINDLQIQITLRIHISIMERLLDYCTYDQFIPDGDSHFIVQFPFIERDYYYHILLGFGDQCECLEPKHVRTEMMRKIEHLSTLYKCNQNIGN